LWLGLLLAAEGCAGYGPVQILNPGTAEQQRAEAERFDPYPEQDLGPAVVGGRPRGYQVPPAEPKRAQGPERWGLLR
jgi:hypothetical protein